MDCVSKTQLQVGENSNCIIFAAQGLKNDKIRDLFLNQF